MEIFYSYHISFLNFFLVETEATFETISFGISKQTDLKKYNVTHYYIWLKKNAVMFYHFFGLE